MDTFASYCVRCRERQTFEAKVVELANGRAAALGSCPRCGTGLTLVIDTACQPKEDH